MEPNVDEEFIRRAIELADLNAVRMALVQHTGDPEIAALPLAIKLDDAQRELLISTAVAWLLEHAGPGAPVPPDSEMRRLLNMATGDNMGDLEFRARRDLPGFKDFPFFAEWTNGRPHLPDGFRVAIIGNGFSGLAMGVQLEQLGIPYIVLERRTEPGGTWTINRYPDVRVDTSSITYEFGFEKNYPWSEYFARGAEVRQYLDHISRKYGVRDNTLFGHDLKTATFDENRDVWVLDVETPDGRKTFEANVIVNAVGTFANPRIPRFEGAEDFEGDIMHPARWPADFDASGRRIAVVGNGSTGVQLVAPLSREAEQVFVFQRTPQWIAPRVNYGRLMEPEIRWLLDNFPSYWNWWRYCATSAYFESHNYLIPDPEWKAQGGVVNQMNDKLREDLTAYITKQVDGDPELLEKLVPDYAPFSRRPVVDNGWYEALTRPNVELVTEGIARLTPKGIEAADGSVYEVDTIVTATGFEVARYLWPASYFGRDGVNIHDFWSKDGARAYLGMMAPGFPNMFMIYGPNSQPVSGGTGLPVWYVIWSAYSAQCIVKILEEGQSRIEVKHEAFERYNERLDEEASKLLLLQQEGAPEKNYYINKEFGRLQVNAPFYGPEFQRMCTEVDWNDLEITSSENR
jgi:4-hydroxyacetophenone monooxygenase